MFSCRRLIGSKFEFVYTYIYSSAVGTRKKRAEGGGAWHVRSGVYGGKINGEHVIDICSTSILFSPTPQSMFFLGSLLFKEVYALTNRIRIPVHDSFQQTNKRLNTSKIMIMTRNYFLYRHDKNIPGIISKQNHTSKPEDSADRDILLDHRFIWHRLTSLTTLKARHLMDLISVHISSSLDLMLLRLKNSCQRISGAPSSLSSSSLLNVEANDENILTFDT